MTKDGYYDLLNRASIQFNSALQDYVSFTVLEATSYGCDIVYPRFKSFPECIPADRLYDPFDVNSALKVLESCIKELHSHFNIPKLSSLGCLMDAYIIKNGIDREVNIWNESEYYEAFLKDKGVL